MRRTGRMADIPPKGLEILDIPPSSPVYRFPPRERICLEKDPDVYTPRSPVERDETGMHMFTASLERTGNLNRSLLRTPRGGWGGFHTFSLEAPSLSSRHGTSRLWTPRDKMGRMNGGIDGTEEMVYVASNLLSGTSKVVNTLDLSKVKRTGKITQSLSARTPRRTPKFLGGGDLSAPNTPGGGAVERTGSAGGGAQTERLSRTKRKEPAITADDLNPEMFATMEKLPDNMGNMLDTIMGIRKPPPRRQSVVATRRLSHHSDNVSVAYSANAGGAMPMGRTGSGGSRMTGGGKGVTAQLDEGGRWIDMARRYWAKEASRTKETVLAFAAETAFSKESQYLIRPSSLSRRDVPILAVPRQWLHNQLTSVKLIACQIPELPDKFGLWVPNLVECWLDHNRLRSLPESFIFIDQLRDIGLTTNQLSAFPTQLCSLTGLQTLGLQNNLIPDVPDNIGTRTSLVALYLAQNPIKKLPLTIGLLSSLVCLTIDREGVDLQVPEWAVDGDTRTLRDYYSHLLNTNVLRFRRTLHANFLRVTIAFRRFDTDRSGDLDQQEMYLALKGLGVEFANFGEMWIVIDKDGSGSIDYEEFLQMVRTERIVDSGEDPEEVLRKGLSEQHRRGSKRVTAPPPRDISPIPIPSDSP